MSQADLETNRNIRRVFVKHFIDLGTMSVRSANGKVTIRGKLARIAGVEEKLTTAIVEVIFHDIRRLPAVTRLDITLDNWTNESGRWCSKQLEPAKSQHPGIQHDITDRTYDLDSDIIG